MNYVKWLKLGVCVIALGADLPAMELHEQSQKETSRLLLENKPYTVIGQLNGELAAFLENKTPLEPLGYSHILMHSKGLSEISEKDLSYVLKSYQQGCIIACLHPTDESLKNLLATLEPTFHYEEETAGIELYAFRKTPAGRKQVTFLASPPRVVLDHSLLESSDNAPEENKKISDLEGLKILEAEDKEASIENSYQRAKQILEWFTIETRQDLTGFNELSDNSSILAPTMIDIKSEKNLYETAAILSDIWKISMPASNMQGGIKGKWRKKFQGPPNISTYFQVSSYARVASVKLLKEERTNHVEEDYAIIIYLIQEPSFAPGFMTIGKDKRPIEMEYYNVRVIPGELNKDKQFPDYTNTFFKNEVIPLIVASPDTPNTPTHYTSSISYNLGTNVGLFANEATGGVSGSVSISHSESRAVSDVTIKHLSHSSEGRNDATWHFDLRKNATTGTFSPYLQAIWRLNTAYKKSSQGDTPQKLNSIPISVIIDAKAKKGHFYNEINFHYAKTFFIDLTDLPPPFDEDSEDEEETPESEKKK